MFTKLLTFILMFCQAAEIGIHDNGASFFTYFLDEFVWWEMTFRVLIEDLTIIQLLETLCSQEHVTGCCPELVESKTHVQGINFLNPKTYFMYYQLSH